MNIKEILFEKSFASHPKSKFWSDKNNLDPRKVSISNGNKFWFNCTECTHQFEISLNNIIVGRWCPYCSHHKLCDNSECINCFEKSFASNLKSEFWSRKNKLKPRHVFKFTTNKYIFDCNKCDHEFETSLSSISNMNSWCSFCTNQKLCENNDCKDCFEKSFTSHEKSKFWSNKNNLQPRQIFKSSNKKYFFNCTKCNHQFKISTSHIRENKWCSYCSLKLLCENDDCKDCFNISFASSDKSIYWSDKNTIKPRQIFKFSSKKFIFLCSNNHEFKTTLCSISNMKSWCPFCTNKTEGIVFEWLEQHYQKVKHQATFEWCKNKQKLPFDFCIENLKIIIELDGAQHFKQISNWQSPEDTQERDKIKMKCALENNYSVIRIKQEDVWFDRIDWKNVLFNSIKMYKTPSIIMLY
jgi:very-short-patch-repair endonuclease